jgi:iron complex transport system permease protein
MQVAGPAPTDCNSVLLKPSNHIGTHIIIHDKACHDMNPVLSHRHHNEWVGGALVALMLSVAPEFQLRGMLFWLMGDLSQAESPWPALLVLVFGLAAVLPFSRDLGLLARGELSAQVLGVPVVGLRLLIYALASLFTAVAVNVAGSIGFIGLIVPHLVRLAAGNDLRLLLPASVLAGATLLVVADTLARILVAPQQLPVGVLTALLGVPVFLYLLSRQPQRSGP